ncbi:MAG: hypothetical protein VZS44_11145 [Bacilli bacterium]|nr:hypothetical protein [Bacilli bacterium]
MENERKNDKMYTIYLQTGEIVAVEGSMIVIDEEEFGEPFLFIEKVNTDGEYYDSAKFKLSRVDGYVEQDLKEFLWSNK